MENVRNLDQLENDIAAMVKRHKAEMLVATTNHAWTNACRERDAAQRELNKLAFDMIDIVQRSGNVTVQCNRIVRQERLFSKLDKTCRRLYHKMIAAEQSYREKYESLNYSCATIENLVSESLYNCEE